MEPDFSSVFRHNKTPSSDRLLGLFSQTPSISSVESELQEDDILWSSSADDDDHSVPSPKPPAPIRTASSVGFPRSQTSGILAALPEPRPSPDRRYIHRRATIGASSSSRITIPSIPKPPSPHEHPAHQSAPVKIPMPSVRRNSEAFDDDEEEADDKMLPPHEIVARSARGTPMTTFSVLEGKGRTLKGRDLRRVRNAVFRQTGFLD